MLTYPNLDPVAFAIGPLKVHWYGLMYLAGFTVSWFLAKSAACAATLLCVLTRWTI